MGDRIRVLYVSDGGSDQPRVKRDLTEHAPLDVVTAAESEALDVLSEQSIEGVVSEHDLDGMNGVELLRLVRDVDPAIPFILFVDNGDEATASEAISAGVTEYVRRTGDEDDYRRLADTVYDAAAQYRAEQDVAMLNDLARNVYERITDAFFALDRDWRFTYVNDQAEKLLDVKAENVIGENVWEVFSEAVGTTFYTEYHRAMATQEPVTFAEYFEPLDTTFEVRAYPSEDGLSVHFRDATEGEQTSGEHLVELTNILSYDLLDSIEKTRESLDEAQSECESEHLDNAVQSLDRMDDLVTHSITLASEY